VELLTSLASFYVAYKFGFTSQTFALLFLTWGLVALTFIDFNTKLLPDGIVLFLLWLGLFLNLFNLFTGITSAVLGAILGYMSLWIIAQFFKLVRKIEGMGHGDFKLFAVFGAWFGWQMLPFIILLASLLALFVGMFLIFSKKLKFDKPISFGPYIALSGWFFIFYGVDIINEVNKFLIFA
jgi:leader peptidase (prepilin peptidase)/N-methyltransferase